MHTAIASYLCFPTLRGLAYLADFEKKLTFRTSKRLKDRRNGFDILFEHDDVINRLFPVGDGGFGGDDDNLQYQ